MSFSRGIEYICINIGEKNEDCTPVLFPLNILVKEHSNNSKSSKSYIKLI